MSPVAISGVDKQGVAVNGVQVKQTLAADSETVNKGVYDATTLSAVDPDLAVGNIKNTITIFGKDGTVVPMDVSDANAAVADVKDPKTFYSVAAPRKTGTMPTVAIVAANDDYLAGYHAGDAGGLDAIDANLAVANIKSGTTIFGKLGTYAQTLAEDITNSAATAILATDTGGYFSSDDLGTNAELTIATVTTTFAAGSMAVACGVALCHTVAGGALKLRLYMQGTLVVETAYISSAPTNARLVGTRALSGSQECKLRAKTTTSSDTLYLGGLDTDNTVAAAAICVGSIKQV